ncbi:MAG TPA: hypothetical protein VGH38_01370 [Bryobacteraceae bacterium]|jgi:hypothetical protein
MSPYESSAYQQYGWNRSRRWHPWRGRRNRSRTPNCRLKERVNNLVPLLTLDNDCAIGADRSRDRKGVVVCTGKKQPGHGTRQRGLRILDDFRFGRLRKSRFQAKTNRHGIGWARGGNLTGAQFPQSVGPGESWIPNCSGSSTGRASAWPWAR